MLIWFYLKYIFRWWLKLRARPKRRRSAPRAMYRAGCTRSKPSSQIPKATKWRQSSSLVIFINLLRLWYFLKIYKTSHIFGDWFQRIWWFGFLILLGNPDFWYLLFAVFANPQRLIFMLEGCGESETRFHTHLRRDSQVEALTEWRDGRRKSREVAKHRKTKRRSVIKQI